MIVWTQQCDRQLPSLLGLFPDPSSSCADTQNIPCFELFNFMECKRVIWASFSLTRAAICPAAVYSLAHLAWFVLLFPPGGVFITVTHRQLDGRANMHGKAHLAAASAAAGREKAWRATGDDDLGISLWGSSLAQPSGRWRECGVLSTWRMLSPVVCS